MKPSTLVEHVADWHAQLEIDRTNRLVRNVALTGGTSKNGYRYQEQALKDAATLYEQRPVFLDHATDKSRPQERSTRDLVGSIVNARYEAGRIRGDIRVLDTDSGRTFLALSESDAPGVGMSHVVLAERDSDDGAVTRIHDVVSVDAVVFPATTTSFRESQDTPRSSECPRTDTSEQESDDNSLPSCHEDSGPTNDVGPANQHESDASDQNSDTENLQQRVQLLLTEREELLTKLQEEQCRQTAVEQEQALDDLIAQSGLPVYAVTETFRRQLTTADETLRRELLQERLTLIEASRRQAPLSRERSSASRATSVDDTFVATIKRQTA